MVTAMEKQTSSTKTIGVENIYRKEHIHINYTLNERAMQLHIVFLFKDFIKNFLREKSFEDFYFLLGTVTSLCL